MIELVNISKTYNLANGSKLDVLKDINLSFPDAGMHFIVGKSGCGKTTLLNLIGAIDAPNEGGQILIDGVDISNKSQAFLSNYRCYDVGFVFQEYNLIDSFTVGENIAITLDLLGKKDDSLIEDALTKVGLSGYINRSISELSGGEKQRVAIARAIVKNPRIILADEPTGNLDSATSKEIFELLKEISLNTTVVIVTHDNDSALTYYDTIFEMQDGVVFNSKHKHYFDGFYRSYDEEMAKNNLSLRNVFRLAFKGMRKRWVRLSMIIFVLMLSLGAIALAGASTFNDIDYIFLKACENNGQKNIVIMKSNEDEMMNNYNITYNMANSDKERLDVILGETNYVPIYEARINNQIGKDGYGLTVNDTFGICEINQELITKYGFSVIEGRYPNSQGEVMISLITFKIYQKDGFKGANGVLYFDNTSQIINEKIEEYTIVGILDTGFNTTIEKDFFTEYEKDAETRTYNYFSSEYNKSIHSSLIASHDTFKGFFVNQLYDKKGNSYNSATIAETKDTIFYNIIEDVNFEHDSVSEIVVPYYYLKTIITLSNYSIDFDPLLCEESEYLMQILSNNNICFTMYFDRENANCNAKARVIGYHNYDSSTIIINDIAGETISKNYLPVVGCFAQLNINHKDNELLLDKLSETFVENEKEYRYYAHNGYWSAIGWMNSAKDKTWMMGFGTIGIVLAIIATLLIWNFIYTVILDDKKDIGILLSLGAQKKDIASIYIIESAFICAVSYILSFAFIPLYRYIFGDLSSQIHFLNYTPGIIFAVLAFSIVIIAMGCSFTLVKFLRKKPVDIIRK